MVMWAFLVSLQGILVSTLSKGLDRVNPSAPSQKSQFRELALSGSSLAAPSQAVNLS